ncbi:MAG: metallophosphoesterase [Gammaproteobacteria bacterium]|nr:metallophosphoesterase [Gammaproteobacteria bacterium]
MAGGHINNRFIIFSDTDNDTACIDNTLEFAGLLLKKNKLDECFNGLSIIHTGDCLDKKAPDLNILDYWQTLEQQVLDSGGFAHLLAGNHEQEIWQKIKNGETYGLLDDELEELCHFIETLDLFYVDGPILFIHAYPTLEFLRVLLHYKEVTGHALNQFNNDYYKKSFKSVESLSQYSYTRGQMNDHYLLYDMENIGSYYRKNGLEITTILAELEIDCIIHGHRPQRSGIQIDYEFSKWLPEIRMIGNDTRVKSEGLGATLMRTDIGRTAQVIFINSRNSNKKTRKKSRHLLRLSAPESATLQQKISESKQCRELNKKIDNINQTHKKSLFAAENKLQAQCTSHLLQQEELQEELQQKNGLYLTSRDQIKTLEANIGLLENKLQQHDKQQPAEQNLNNEKEVPILSVSNFSLEIANKQNNITEKTLESLEQSGMQLQQELKKSNETRKQAVDYLRVCHESNQNMSKNLKQCTDDKTELEEVYNNVQKIKLTEKKENTPGKETIYIAIISSVLTGLAVFFLF